MRHERGFSHCPYNRAVLSSAHHGDLIMDRRLLLASAGIGSILATAAAEAQTTPAAPVTPNGSNLNQIRSSGVIRLAVIPNQEPHFHKDLATGEWSGTVLSMGRDLARILGVRLETHETTWSNAILEVQSNRIDLAFGLNPTTERALAVDFSVPLYNTAYVVISRRNQTPPTAWEELNRETAKVGVVIGTTYETIARRMLPKARITSYRNRDESLISVATGHVDFAVDGAILAIKSITANPNIGRLSVPTPIVSLPSCAAMRIDTDKRLRDVMGIWAEYNRSLGQIRAWVLDGFKAAGVEPENIPAGVNF